MAGGGRKQQPRPDANQARMDKKDRDIGGEKQFKKKNQKSTRGRQEGSKSSRRTKEGRDENTKR